MIGPKPGQTSECNFQTARPINTDRVRVVDLPVPPLAQDLVDEVRIAGQPIGLRQGDKMLMAIQFPGDLAVTRFFEIQITHFVKNLPGSPLPVDRVEMPVNRIAVLNALIPQQVKAMPANIFRPLDDLLGLTGKTLPQGRQDGIDRIRREEKPPGVGGGRRPRALCEIGAQAIENGVLPLTEFLPNPVAPLLPIHLRQSAFDLTPVSKLHWEWIFCTPQPSPYLNYLRAWQIPHERSEGLISASASYIIDCRIITFGSRRQFPVLSLGEIHMSTEL